MVSTTKRAFPEPNDELRQPSDAYLKQLLPLGHFKAQSRTDVPQYMLETLYFEERGGQWIEAHATAADITFKDLLDRWSDDLEPLPPLSPRGGDLADLLLGNKRGKSGEVAGIDNLPDENSQSSDLLTSFQDQELLLETITFALIEARRRLQVSKWAWERDGLLAFNGRLYVPQQPPPPWMIEAVSYCHSVFMPDGEHLAYRPTVPQRKEDEGQKRGSNHVPPPSRHKKILAYTPVQAYMEAIGMFAEHNGIVYTPYRAPHVITHNGGIISFGGSLDTALDEDQSRDASDASLTLSNDTAAAFVLSLARWCAEADHRNPRSYVIVTVNEYCEARGWRKHHKGGYQSVHKQKARQHFLALNKLWGRHKIPSHILQARTKNGAKSASRYVEGQAMHVSVESADASGHTPTAFRVSPGTWVDDFLRDNPKCVALVLERILSIDSGTRTGDIAYRVGLYISLNWRTKILKNNSGQGHRVRELLKATGIDPHEITHHEQRKRLRSCLEGALDLLQTADVLGSRDDEGALITGWEYGNASAGNPDASAAWDEWLNWLILLPPPHIVQSFYQDTHRSSIDHKAQTLARPSLAEATTATSPGMNTRVNTDRRPRTTSHARPH